ncbi:MAG: hypothetical protein KBH78_05790 [Candidatus Hydrogenedentes bacterium]|nr:hypothetical protein [Candidatus Hydrogenedentota bacterium]
MPDFTEDINWGRGQPVPEWLLQRSFARNVALPEALLLFPECRPLERTFALDEQSEKKLLTGTPVRQGMSNPPQKTPLQPHTPLKNSAKNVAKFSGLC